MKELQFGKTKAAICLVNMLVKPEYNKFQRQISSHLSKYNNAVNEIYIGIKTSGIRKSLLKLVFEKFKENIIINNLPKEIRCYILNIATANYRAAIKDSKDRNNFTRKWEKLCPKS